MRDDIFYPSCGVGQIHACRWVPEGEIRGIVQIIHGIAEHVGRYEAFAAYLNRHGILVVAEDHMGHGGSIGTQGVQGYFHGGWFRAVEDSYQLMKQTMETYPGIPYTLLGHSMGSFMARTILIDHPDSGIQNCILSGTAWQPAALMKAVKPVCTLFCMGDRESKPSPILQGMAFGGYTKRIENPKTPYDWTSRDEKRVAEYAADPLCGFTATAGLLRDMMYGIDYIQQTDNLRKMNMHLPVLFAAGGDDPVGNYGKGVRQAAQEFSQAGMEHVDIKIYPLMRHEIINEIGREEVYEYLRIWAEEHWHK